jgi:putative endonuclease
VTSTALCWLTAQEWALGRVDALGTRLRGRSTGPRHLAVGLSGERAALFELRRRGYTVVARRWGSVKVRGDLDLVAWDGEWLCFVEVKTRTARDMTPAESAVDEDKRTTLRRLARIYLHGFPEGERRKIPARFDVVSVYCVEGKNEFEVFQNAFGWR